jgi:hypothetical protein
MKFFGQESYSKTVLKHFRNPHNFGVMKDPDAIGKVGNPRCILPGTNIHINDKIMKISEVKSDNVLTHEGVYNKISQKFERKHNGKIIKLRNNLGSISLTPDHMVFSVKIPRRWKYNYTKNRKKLEAAWYHAEELQKRDFIAYPILKEVEDIEKIKTNVGKLKWDHNSKKIPEEVSIDNDFLRLAGYFISEGCLRDEITKTYIQFSFHIREVEYAKDVCTIIKKIFPTLKMEMEMNYGNLTLQI